MTEKRFKLFTGNNYGVQKVDGEVIIDSIISIGDADVLVDWLNEQHEQINTLRESRRKLISANNDYRMRETELAQELSALVDENEQLKSRVDYLERKIQRERNINVKEHEKWEEEIQKENEELKQQLNYYKAMVHTQNDR